MAKILVTGGSGFIGSNIADLLINEGHQVKIFDLDFNDNIKHLVDNENIHFVKGDILNSDVLSKELDDVNVVLHQAGNAYAGKSIDNPLWDLKLNTEGSLNILEACRKKDIERFVFASSMYVYGASVSNPIAESHPTNPSSPYGTSKLLAEHFINLYNLNYGLPTVILRYFKVYGPRHKGALTVITSNLVQRKNVKIYGEGTQSLDFIHVEDVARANLLAAVGSKCVGGTFNIGSGKEVSINGLVELICELAQIKDIEREYLPLGSSLEPLHFVADLNNANQILDFYPRVMLEDGIKRIIESL
jgi:nucleoside-diphosphate-sugar epimerase